MGPAIMRILSAGSRKASGSSLFGCPIGQLRTRRPACGISTSVLLPNWHASSMLAKAMRNGFTPKPGYHIANISKWRNGGSLKRKAKPPIRHSLNSPKNNFWFQLGDGMAHAGNEGAWGFGEFRRAQPVGEKPYQPLPARTCHGRSRILVRR